MDYETIVLKREDSIATLTFNRPHRLNAITFQMIDEIGQAIQEVGKDETKDKINFGVNRYSVGFWDFNVFH